MGDRDNNGLTVCVNKCGQSQKSAKAVTRQKSTTPVKRLTAKQRFLSTKNSHRTEIHNDKILVPETPINDQGMTLRDKLLRKSKRLAERCIVKES